MKKRLVWIALAVAVGLFAAGAWAFIQPGFAVAELQDYVARKTGRTLLVNGGARIEFSPQLSVRLEDVFLSNANGMDGNFARAASARLPLQFADLFRRKLKIREITLVQPVFNFLIDGKGQDSWSVDGKGSKEGKEVASKGTTAKEPLRLLVENGSANFLDERNGQAFSLEEATASVAIAEDGGLSVEGTAALNKQFARIEAQVKSMPRVGQDGSPFDLTVTSPALSANFTGRLATHEGLNLAGAIDAASPDLRQLAKWLGFEIKGNTGLKNFSLAGAIDTKEAVLSLARASIALDGMVASGDLALDLSRQTPRVTATLSTDVFTLDPYLSSSQPVIAGVGTENAGWSTSALSLKGLQGVDGRLSLSAFLVKWNGAEFGPAELSGTLEGGKLEAAVQEASLYGGKATAKIVLDGAQDSPALRLELEAREIKGEGFLSAFAGLDWLAGKTALKASLSAVGHNQQEMMSSLTGSFSIDVSDGEITGLSIVDMVSKVSETLSDGWGSGPENLTSFDTAKASFRIEDGVARTEDARIEGPAFEVSGGGEVDMLRRALDLKFDPELVAGDNETFKLPVKVVVKGQWSAPNIYPDVEGILDNPEAAYSALRGLGVSDKLLKKIEKQGGDLLNELFGN